MTSNAPRSTHPHRQRTARSARALPSLRRLVLLTVAAALAAFASSALAQVVIHPQSIVVNPVPAFGVDVFLDKSSSSRDDSRAETAPSYRINETVSISVRVDRDAYVYLFDVKPNGAITQILPNRLSGGQSNRVSAGSTITFPPRGAPYRFVVDGPRGLSKVIAVASLRPLDTEQLAQFKGGDFAESDIGEVGFANAFSIIVRPVPQSQWVTDTALYWVGERQVTPSYGTLDIRSTPSNADVFVDGRYIGRTPVRYPVVEGRYDITIEREGYQTLQRTIGIRAGGTQRMTFDLQRVEARGFLRFGSSPSGAEVFVDGSFVGTTPTGRIALDEGSYRVTFRLDGYQEQTVQTRVEKNRERTIQAELYRATGTLVLYANVGGARVFLDGNEVGVIPSGSGRLEIPDLEGGQYEVTVVAPGYATLVDLVRIQAGFATTLEVQQQRR